MLVLGLLAVALVVALVLWAMIRRDAAGGGSAATTVATTQPVAAGPAEIASIVAYDPDGDDEENNDLANAALADGSSATNWRTVCYARSLMSGKAGVGLALTLAAPATGTLSFEVGNAPFQVEVLGSDAPTRAGQLRRLGSAARPEGGVGHADDRQRHRGDTGAPPADRAPRARA